MQEADLPAASTQGADCNPDLPGELSIVVQGGLSELNLAEVANNVQHWRTLFPAAQMIVSLSGSSILEGDLKSGRVLSQPKLAEPFARDSHLVAAVSVLVENADKFVLARQALPLPPIKSDSKHKNNINLQIAAAQSGLDHADGRYVLRVRSDLTFLDRSFIDQYHNMVDLPRGEAALLQRRVLISWLYTLNPFTEERLPLHLSDWFHFGLKRDVDRLWRVPDMSLRDAVFYRSHPHAPHSNSAERLFYTRLAVEQHLAVNALASAEAEAATLPDYHNDLAPAVQAIRILTDNFVLCDMIAARCHFPKYEHEFYNHRKLTACVTPDDWRALASLPYVDPRITLSHKIQRVREPVHHEFRQGFPRQIQASQLTSEIGQLERGVLITNGDGVAARSPRIGLPPARYRVELAASPIEGEGTLQIVVTCQGDRVVGEANFDRNTPVGERIVHFEIDGFAMDDVEIVCRSAGLNSVSIEGLSIDKAQPTPTDVPWPRIVPLVPTSCSNADERRSTKIDLLPGSYVAAFDLPVPSAQADLSISIINADAGRVIACARADDLNGAAFCQIAFDIRTLDVRRIVLSCAGAGLPGDIKAVLARQNWDPWDGAVPRFFDAQCLRAANGTAHEDRVQSDGRSGRLCFGPYANLASGRYTAIVHFGGDTPRLMSVTITAQHGNQRIRVERFTRRQMQAGQVAVPFQIGEQGASLVEVVCRVVQPGSMHVTGVTLERAMPVD